MTEVRSVLPIPEDVSDRKIAGIKREMEELRRERDEVCRAFSHARSAKSSAHSEREV